ncbi:MAG: DUF11 domain-containing protein, partial [Chloroflexi bacterium]|nr:DUF11 domain-containing protein [Chloroflexota bacterium]
LVLLMQADGTVSSSVKLAHNLNGGPPLVDNDYFGSSVSETSDLNGDGVNDLAVGAYLDDTGGNKRGAVYVLLMQADGTVSSSVKLAHNLNGGPSLADSDRFGTSVSEIGDLNGDGVLDLAVGAYGDDTGGSDRGAVYVLLMKADGTVSSSVKLAHNTNGGPSLVDGDEFGVSVSEIGDLNGDGVNYLAVGAYLDDTGGIDRGAVYVLLMQADGTVDSSVKLAHNLNGGPPLVDYDYFGSSVSETSDLNGDGVNDLAVGAYLDDTGGLSRGAVYVLLMQADGTVSSSVKLAHNLNGGPSLVDWENFGRSVSEIGDLNGDGVLDLAVGADRDDTGGSDRGAVYVLFGQAVAQAGESITYTLSFGNSGGSTASGVVITDIVPITVTNTSVVSNGVTITQTNVGAITYTWQVQDLAPNEGGVITISGQIDANISLVTTFTNTAQITTTTTDGDTSNNDASAGLLVVVPEIAVLGNGTVIPDGDLTPAVSDDTDFGNALVVGGTVTRTFTISNSGARDLKLSGTPNVTLTTGTHFSVTLQPGSSTIGSGVTTTFQIAFDPSAVGSHQDTVNIQSNDVDENPYTFVLSGTGTVADLSLTKSVNPGTALPGDTITYTLSFSNVGTGPASGVVITDRIPVSITANSPSYTYTGALITATGSISYVWTVQDLEVGTGGVITITGVLSDPLEVGTFTNTATITMTTAEAVTTNNSSSAGITVSSSGVNNPPVANDDTGSTDEDTPVTIDVLDNDTDPDAGDSLSVGAVGQPSYGDAAIVGAQVVYTPTNRAASYNAVFTYTVSDGALSDGATVTVSVTADNDAPWAMDDGYSTLRNGVLRVDAPGVLGNDGDLENTVLTAVLDSQPISGELDLQLNGTLVYTPSVDFAGTISFTYHANDGVLDSNPAVATIDVLSTTPPIAAFSLSAQPDTLYANGLDESVLSIRAEDVNGEGAWFVGHTVDLMVGGDGVVSPTQVVLDANGTATTTYQAGLLAGAETITATVDDQYSTKVATTTLTLQSNPLNGQLTSEFSSNVITYTFIISNVTPAQQRGVVLTGTVPDGTTLIRVTGGISVEQGGQVYVVSPITDLDQGQRTEMTWTVQVPQFLIGEIVCRAWATSLTAKLETSSSERLYRVLLVPIYKNYGF